MSTEQDYEKKINSVNPFYGHFLFICLKVRWTVDYFHCYFNPFVPNAPFLHLLKTSENRKD